MKNFNNILKLTESSYKNLFSIPSRSFNYLNNGVLNNSTQKITNAMKDPKVIENSNKLVNDISAISKYSLTNAYHFANFGFNCMKLYGQYLSLGGTLTSYLYNKRNFNAYPLETKQNMMEEFYETNILEAVCNPDEQPWKWILVNGEVVANEMFKDEYNQKTNAIGNTIESVKMDLASINENNVQKQKALLNLYENGSNFWNSVKTALTEEEKTKNQVQQKTNCQYKIKKLQ